MLSSYSYWKWLRGVGLLLVVAGAINLILAPLIGGEVFASLWAVEPLAYIGAVLVLAGLVGISLSYVLLQVLTMKGSGRASDGGTKGWVETTQQYFDMFNHDIGRPLRRILGKERELRAMMRTGALDVETPVRELLDEIEAQTPNFRLIMTNIQTMVQMEASAGPPMLEPVEPVEVVRKVVERYIPVAGEAGKEITWWAEPGEFGIVLLNGAALEHVLANLVDNGVRFATNHVEVRLTQNPTHFFVRVWDDGPGIPSQYLPHIFDQGWTPEVARREEKRSSGLGLYITRTLARRYGGEVTVQSTAAPDSQHSTSFLVSFPLARSKATSL